MNVAAENYEFGDEVERLVRSLPAPQSTNIYRQILLAYDGSDGARAALGRVAAIASVESIVTVITVIPFEAIGASLDPIKPELREWQWHALAEATALLRQRGVHAFIEAATGNPVAVILEVARTLKADVVVVGRGSVRGWRPSMKRHSVSRAIVQRLGCDTLVVAA